MLLNEVIGEGADDIDPQVVFSGVLKRRGDELKADAFSALVFGDLGVPDGHPAVPIRFEFQIADLSILFDLETASGYFGRFVHSVSALQMTKRRPATQWRRGGCVSRPRLEPV